MGESGNKYADYRLIGHISCTIHCAIRLGIIEFGWQSERFSPNPDVMPIIAR
jgi:hypothetical protein